MVNLAYAQTDLVTGVHDYQDRKLNMLQIGLGTFGTFLQNLTCPSEAYPGVSWLMEATSDSSQRMAAVGVEPVPEHARRLQPLLKELPQAALVQAAVGRQDKTVEVYAITPECYKKCASTLRPTELKTFDDLVIFLRNMSCVGQAHPEFQRFSTELEAQCGVKVETEPIAARAVTYSALARMLNFSGVEVLLIDAEGYDCKILQSMVDHCTQYGNDSAWPEVIQFETMGHNNWMHDSTGGDAEAEMCGVLERHGYVVGCYGSDTQLVREASLAHEPRLQRWVRTFRCARCSAEGLDGMPFRAVCGSGTLCRDCAALRQSFGTSVFEWESLPGDRQLASISSNGASLWGVDAAGRALCCREGHWQELGGEGLRHVSASQDEEHIWGVDRSGRVLRCVSPEAGRWEEVGGSPRLAHLCISGNGQWVWGTAWAGELFMHRRGQRSWRRSEWDWLEQVSLSHDGNYAWGINPNGKVFCRQGGSEAEWVAVAGSLRQVAISGDGRHVWGVNASNQVFHRHAHRGSWRRVPGSLTQVCTSDDSSRVWGIDTYSHVWTFCCA